MKPVCSTVQSHDGAETARGSCCRLSGISIIINFTINGGYLYTVYKSVFIQSDNEGIAFLFYLRV